MMYTDSKLGADTTSDSDWDELTTQPEVELTTLSDNHSAPKAKHKDHPTRMQGHVETEKASTEPIERTTKQKSNPETKQLGASKTVPKLPLAAPTPPALSKPKRSRRRQERSMDPPYEFSSLTVEESDSRTLSKAVSAPLKSSKYHADQVAEIPRTFFSKRDSWDEVSELPDDSQARVIEKTKKSADAKDTTHPAKIPVRSDPQVEGSAQPQTKYTDSIQEIAREGSRSDARDAETFTIQEPAKHQPLFQPQPRENHYIQTTSLQSPSPLEPSPRQSIPHRTHHENKFNLTDKAEGIYLFEEMSNEYVNYEQDLPEAFMMKLAQRSEKRIQRFWQELFGCLRLFCSFFTLFFIECVRFCLRHIVQKLCIGILIVCADHVWKPLLQCCYNGCLLPGCVVCANSCTSLVQIFKPVLKCCASILREFSKCCSNFRLCEVIYPGSHQDHATRFKTQVI